MLRVIRAILLSLLFSLLFGLVVGTLIRMRLERPVYYIGQISRECGAGSAISAPPLHIPEPSALVLDARHDEEQVG
jgi:hypothetical protein